MKKYSNKKKKQVIPVSKKFAYGGTAINMLTPSEEVAKNRKANIEATYEGMMNPTANILGGLGGFLANTGLNLVTSGVSKAGGFGKVLGGNDKLSGFGTALDGLLGIQTGEAGIGKIDKVLPGAEVERVNTESDTINPINSVTIPSSFGGAKGFGKSQLSQWLKDNVGLLTNTPYSIPSFAYGGTVPIEAEGGEIIETPNGIPQELIGPSHEGGGMDMLVPPGTDIYSNRVKGVDGRTMAKRKKDRERKEAKLKKLLEKNPSDKTLQKTLKKIQADNEIEDQQDMEYMRSLQESQQIFALGGSVNPPSKDIKELELVKKKNFLKDPLPYYPKLDITYPIGNTYPIIPEFNLNTYNTPQTTTEVEDKKGFWDILKSIKHPLKEATSGDIIGMYSNWKSGRDQMQNTLNQFKNTPNEENHYKNYGKEALGLIRDQYGVLEGIRDKAIQDISLTRADAINRNSNSARGINTIRALNLATDATTNKSISDIYNNYNTQRMQIMDKEATQLDEINAKVMAGEETRAKNQLENQDAFFTQMGTNIADKYKGYANIAKVLNNRKEYELKKGTLLNANQYITVDENGNFKINLDAIKESAKVTAETAKNNDNTQNYTNAGEGSEVKEYIGKDGDLTKQASKELESKSWLWQGVTNPETGKVFSSAKEYGQFIDKSNNNKYFSNKYQIKYPYDHTQYIDPTTKQPFESYEDFVKYSKVDDVNRLEKISKINNNERISNPTQKLPLLKSSLSENQIKDLDKVLNKLNINVDLSDSKSIKELQKSLDMSTKLRTGRFGKATLEQIKKYIKDNNL